MRSVGDIILAGFSQLKNARIENLASDPSQPQAGQVWYNTTDGVFRGFNGTAVITFATGGSTAVLLQEIDAIETSIGLNSDGTYSALVGSTYLDSATSVADAASKLDVAVKAAADAVAAETTRATGAEGTIAAAVAAETTRATAAEGTIAAAVAAETTRATAAEGTIAANLAAEVSRAGAAEGTLTAAVAAEVTRAGAAEASLAADLASEITRAGIAETSIASDLAAEVTRATAAEGSVAAALAGEVTRATAAEGTIAANLATETTRATAAEAGLDTRLATVEGAFINKDGSVAFTGDQSMGSHALTNVATPTVGGDAANKSYVDNKVGSLGAAFSYVGTLNGGATIGEAFLLEGASQVTPGAYYKVATAGYFKLGTEDALYANTNDGLVFNTLDGIDVIDNTNSQVQGTTNFVTVSGSADLGYTVDLDATFKGRVTTVEADLAAEVTRATAAESTLTTNLAAEVTRATGAEGTIAANLVAEITRAGGAETSIAADLASEVTRAQTAETSIASSLAAEVTRATGAEGSIAASVAAETTRATTAEGSIAADLAGEVTRATAAESTIAANLVAETTRATAAEGSISAALSAEVTRATGVEAGLQTEVDAVETAVGLASDGTFVAFSGTNYLDAATSVVGGEVKLDLALKALADRFAGSTFVYDGSTASTSHSVVHGLGQKYCQVTVVDSADKVILPDTITFNSNSTLTVDFSSAITCKVIVTAAKA